jgi:hypothetical protein
MTAQELCVSLEEAKKLKAAGFQQEDTLFIWYPDVRGDFVIWDAQTLNKKHMDGFIAAPTIGELLAEIDLTDSGNFDAVCDILAQVTAGGDQSFKPDDFLQLWLKVKGGPNV